MDDVAQKTIGVAGFDPLPKYTDCARLGSTIVSSLTAGYFWWLCRPSVLISKMHQNAILRCGFQQNPDQLGVNNWSFTRYKTELYWLGGLLLYSTSSSIAIVNWSCQVGNIQWTRCSPILPKLALFRLPWVPPARHIMPYKYIICLPYNTPMKMTNVMMTLAGNQWTSMVSPVTLGSLMT